MLASHQRRRLLLALSPLLLVGLIAAALALLILREPEPVAGRAPAPEPSAAVEGARG